MKYWLMKSEPSTYSIDDLKREGASAWEGVRNFQARNYMRDEMRIGDLALFYHSVIVPPGIAGICRICRESFPDHTALDPKSRYFDPKASPENPIWMMVKVEFVEKFPHYVTLEELKADPHFEGMKVLQKGSRLSIMPVEPAHFKLICKLGQQ